ncbi:MAG: virulence RhuM family protein [Candidatus Marinimicrobia bacterium]|nr:virulence RhuM family protein [Candidatus Neomarinimicrobiota bacterium]
MNDNFGDILIYQNEKGETKIDAYFNEDTIWLTQKSMSSLYQVSLKTINEHANNIIGEGELLDGATIRKFRIVQNEGTRKVEREILHYNLDMVLAIGYRVRSNVGIHFRNWASSVITEYAKKGFVMNDERLKDPKKFGDDYFDELLERIRDIRSSEKRLYAKVKDIFATAVDYDGKSERAQLFFQTVQNKIHYATHGNTAAEVIAKRVDASKDNMGLTSFKGAKVRKADIVIAKNYLDAEELDKLNRIVSMYLEFAELQAKNKIPMHMSDWELKLNEFLRFNSREVLDNAGTITSQMAKEIAEKQYENYDKNRKKIEADISEIKN